MTTTESHGRGRRFAALALVLDVAAIPFFFSWTTIALLFYALTLLGLLMGVIGVGLIGAVLRYPMAARLAVILVLMIPFVNAVLLSFVLLSSGGKVDAHARSVRARDV